MKQEALTLDSAVKFFKKKYFKNSELPEFILNLFKGAFHFIDVDDPRSYEQLMIVTAIEGALKVFGVKQIDLIFKIYKIHNREQIYLYNQIGYELILDHHDYLLTKDPIYCYAHDIIKKWSETSLEDLDFTKFDEDFLGISEDVKLNLSKKIEKIFNMFLIDIETNGKKGLAEIVNWDVDEQTEEVMGRIINGGVSLNDIRFLNYVSKSSSLNLTEVIELFSVILFEKTHGYFKEISDICNKSTTIKRWITEIKKDWDSFEHKEVTLLFESYLDKTQKDYLKLVSIYKKFKKDFVNYNDRFFQKFEEILYERIIDEQSSDNEEPHGLVHRIQLGDKGYRLNNVQFSRDFTKVYFDGSSEPVTFTKSQALVLKIMYNEYNKNVFRPKQSYILEQVFRIRENEYYSEMEKAKQKGIKLKLKKPSKPKSLQKSSKRNSTISIGKLYFHQRKTKGGNHIAFGKGKFIVPIPSIEDPAFGCTWSLTFNFGWRP